MEPSTAKAGFEEEALPHLDAVYRFALRLSGSVDEAEDLVQETFLRAYNAWDQYQKGTRAKSWLFTICRNVFLRRRERAQRHEEILSENVDRDAQGPELANPLWSSTSGFDPEGEFFASIVDERIIEALEDLPEEYRTAVVLSDIEGLPYAEIAEMVGVPVGTVKSRLFRGRRRLQEALFDHAVEAGLVPASAGVEGGA